MPTTAPPDLATFIADGLRDRNRVSAAVFPQAGERVAEMSRQMADRFLRGGRLLAFGRGQWATDAQHVSVEFVHPVIVGKRALPALDLSLAFADWLPAIVRADDIVIGFGSPDAEPLVREALETARQRGAMVLALPGGPRDLMPAGVSDDPFVVQEVVEVLYHTLWETVHVFFEHRERGHDLGATGFLYPFLGRERQDTDLMLADVAASVQSKAQEDERLREEVAAEPGAIAAAVEAMHARLMESGTLIFFGNGGSATDANDCALDCVAPPKNYRAWPAVSLAMEPASISAIANDIGAEAVFLRQLIALGRSGDVAVAISTSGGSRNVVSALEHAKRRDLVTVALLGGDGGEVIRRGLADHAIVVASDYVPRIQEVQASIYHVMVDALQTLNWRPGRS